MTEKNIVETLKEILHFLFYYQINYACLSLSSNFDRIFST